jgi:hypothetical protein
MSSKDNKSYTKVRTELSKMYKPSQYQTLYNNLVAVANTTEDRILIKLINNYCNAISDIPSLAIKKLALSLNESMNNSLQARLELDSYCAEVISSHKPEWQVLAERHGWKPSN